MYDIIIIGAGIAGLSLALKASENQARVLVLTKKQKITNTSSNLAQGGIAAVWSPTDSFESHIADTLEAGDGLCKLQRVKTLVEKGPQTIEQLIKWGVNFSRNPDGSFHLALEGGHSQNRILHAHDLTGKEIMRALNKRVQANSHIEFVDQGQVCELIYSDFQGEKRCMGVKVIFAAKQVTQVFWAKTTVIATGGAGSLWPHSTNPPTATGDAFSLAWRAGATLESLEFMQFHPTSLYNPKAKRAFLISEAVRGFGGILKNHAGEELMNGVHPLRSLAPRDVVARAIHTEMSQSGKAHVWLDLSHRKPKDIRAHFPNIYRHCLEIGIDMTSDWIPVVPAAHYSCGGIMVDSWSQSSLAGLYVCGEAASTGVHGANRLASNSLLESVVFSLRAWKKIRSELKNLPQSWDYAKIYTPDHRISFKKESKWRRYKHKLHQIMWQNCGIVHTVKGLEKAEREISAILQEISSLSTNKISVELYNLLNQAQSSLLIVQSALQRRESRGLHALLDYPQKKKNMEKTVRINKNDFQPR
ncbi:MAG: L-aspartate oxidase [Fibrobacter sp.]|nr:L-aspartate oxidase [Fibrobacter sp.]